MAYRSSFTLRSEFVSWKCSFSFFPIRCVGLSVYATENFIIFSVDVDTVVGVIVVNAYGVLISKFPSPNDKPLANTFFLCQHPAFIFDS